MPVNFDQIRSKPERSRCKTLTPPATLYRFLYHSPDSPSVNRVFGNYHKERRVNCIDAFAQSGTLTAALTAVLEKSSSVRSNAAFTPVYPLFREV
jgi:hypothetical protein